MHMVGGYRVATSWIPMVYRAATVWIPSDYLAATVGVTVYFPRV